MIQQNNEDKVEDGVLMAVFDRDRATLPLYAQASFITDRRRRNRLRDVARVLRSQHKSGRQFSLRINSDFSKALTLLREHHEDSWVGSTLEGIWGQMFKSSDLIIFELWIREGENEKMVAADFGHPHSTFGFYVATRFFDRNYKTCMPGFILAFAEAQVLAQHGFDFWDLGGVNPSPMMQYKPQVALEMRRDVFMDLLNATRRHERVGESQPPKRLIPGVVVSEIIEENLWAAATLNELPQQRPGKNGKPKPLKSQQKSAQARNVSPELVLGHPAPLEPVAPPEAPEEVPEQTIKTDGIAGPASNKAAIMAKFKSLVAELVSNGSDYDGAVAEALVRVGKGA